MCALYVLKKKRKKKKQAKKRNPPNSSYITQRFLGRKRLTPKGSFCSVTAPTTVGRAAVRALFPETGSESGGAQRGMEEMQLPGG